MAVTARQNRDVTMCIGSKDSSGISFPHHCKCKEVLVLQAKQFPAYEGHAPVIRRGWDEASGGRRVMHAKRGGLE